MYLVKLCTTECPFKIIHSVFPLNYIQGKDIGGGEFCLEYLFATSGIDEIGTALLGREEGILASAIGSQSAVQIIEAVCCW
jgi:hypothetical protein